MDLYEHFLETGAVLMIIHPIVIYYLHNVSFSLLDVMSPM